MNVGNAKKGAFISLKFIAAVFICLTMAIVSANAADKGKNDEHKNRGKNKIQNIQLGPRTFFLVEDMDEGDLKDQLNEEGNIIPSVYAEDAKRAGLDIITWTLERDGPLSTGGGWYHQTITDAIDNGGDTYTVLDVLAKDVGILGIFSDWPATVTFYANCMGLK